MRCSTRTGDCHETSTSSLVNSAPVVLARLPDQATVVILLNIIRTVVACVNAAARHTCKPVADNVDEHAQVLFRHGLWLLDQAVREMVTAEALAQGRARDLMQVTLAEIRGLPEVVE